MPGCVDWEAVCHADSFIFFTNAILLISTKSTSMRTPILLALICLVSFNCSTRKVQDGSEAFIDSSGTTTIQQVEELVADSANSDYEGTDTLQISIEYAVEQTATEHESLSRYTLNASFSGYETSTEATYHFDSLISLTHCSASWSSEGTSGTYTYYFKDNKIVAGREENYYNDFEEVVTLHSAFNPVFGFTKTNGSEDDSDVTYLGEADFESRNSDAQNQFRNLLTRIAEYQDSIITNGETITIHIENIVNYGEDFTETEHFEISKPVFESLISN